MKEMKGVCFLHSETGTEGGWWAMQQDGYISDDGHWRYEGMRYLEEGDDFTVFADDGSILWHGIIHQDDETGAVPHRVIRKARSLSTIRGSSRLLAACGYIGFKRNGPGGLGRIVHRGKALHYQA